MEATCFVFRLYTNLFAVCNPFSVSLYILGKAVFANSDPPPKYPVLG